jgi:hypothetical protein
MSVHAQDNTLLASADTGRGHNDLTARESTPKARLSLNLDFSETYQRTPYFDNYWTEYANQPKKVYAKEYGGLYGVIYSQIQRQATKFYKPRVKELWSSSYLHPLDLDTQVRNYQLFTTDFGNRYWEQRENFWDYYPIDKGGAESLVTVVGRSYEIGQLGPLSLTNTGKVSLSDWKFSVDKDVDTDDLDNDIINTDPRLDRTPINTNRVGNGRININDYALGISPPDGNIYANRYLSVSGSIRFNIKGNLDRDNGSAIKGRLKFTGFSRNGPWLKSYLKVSVKPFRDQYSIQLLLAFVRF